MIVIPEHKGTVNKIPSNQLYIKCDACSIPYRHYKGKFFGVGVSYFCFDCLIKLKKEIDNELERL